jgi:hypothetical protein
MERGGRGRISDIMKKFAWKDGLRKTMRLFCQELRTSWKWTRKSTSIIRPRGLVLVFFSVLCWALSILIMNTTNQRLRFLSSVASPRRPWHLHLKNREIWFSETHPRKIWETPLWEQQMQVFAENLIQLKINNRTRRSPLLPRCCFNRFACSFSRRDWNDGE